MLRVWACTWWAAGRKASESGAGVSEIIKANLETTYCPPRPFAFFHHEPHLYAPPETPHVKTPRGQEKHRSHREKRSPTHTPPPTLSSHNTALALGVRVCGKKVFFHTPAPLQRHAHWRGRGAAPSLFLALTCIFDLLLASPPGACPGVGGGGSAGRVAARGHQPPLQRPISLFSISLLSTQVTRPEKHITRARALFTPLRRRTSCPSSCGRPRRRPRPWRA